MKKMLLVGIPMLFSSAAFAHGAVTLYGVIDDGFTFTSNAQDKKALQMANGVLSGSRWGLQGGENLGGGLRAIFTLENGFDLNNGKLGQGGAMFGRQAFVGLQTADAGTVTFGRQYDSLVQFLAPLTANGSVAGTYFSHPFDNDNTGNSFRINNAIKYTSDNFSGLRFGALYGLSNSPGAFATNRAYSLGASYDIEGLSLAAAYLQLNDANHGDDGAVTEFGFGAHRQRVWGAGARYKINAATVGLVYTHTTADTPTVKNPAGQPLYSASALTFDNIELNGSYQLTPALSATAMYSFTAGKYADGVDDGKPTWHQFGLSADYSLSKRTDVYVQGVYQHAGGKLNRSAKNVAAVVGSAGISSSRSQTVARVGLRHVF